MRGHAGLHAGAARHLVPRPQERNPAREAPVLLPAHCQSVPGGVLQAELVLLLVSAAHMFVFVRTWRATSLSFIAAHTQAV